MRALRLTSFLPHHEGPRGTMLRGDLRNTVDVEEAQRRQTVRIVAINLNARTRRRQQSRRPLPGWTQLPQEVVA